jgi:DNA-binding transcriptional MocR family regulator
VLVAPGTDWFPAEPPGAFLRLNYTGAPPDRFDAALATVASALPQPSKSR